jgi:hypothetical protein
MKKLILALSFALVSFAASAQLEKRTDNGMISIYPNPATEYITVSNEDAVKSIVLFNMVGRKMRTFTIEKGERYEIGDLPNGLYVVQLFSKSNKVLTTQRLTKK